MWSRRLADLPSGIYERLVTAELERLLTSVPRERVAREPIDSGDSHDVLARHVHAVVRRALRGIGGEESDRVRRQVDATNAILKAIASALSGPDDSEQSIAQAKDVLHAVVPREGRPGPVSFPPRPTVPLSISALLVNGRDQPRIGTEVKNELASADSVDLLCAFVKWTGLRVLEADIARFIERGGSLRVITTTYMGATEADALDRLVEMGAEVKVSYDTRSTRLHAKAWLFNRSTGFSTAYVGSSNLSRAALLDGLEWNVRLSAVEQEHLVDMVRATFAEYWEDNAFLSYDPADASQRARLREALRLAGSDSVDVPLAITAFEITPWPYQQEVLDELSAEREVHDRWRNLVVMATGTGKTVVAALDYRRLRIGGLVDRVLFVAHREELLSQSLGTFRQVLKDGAFGERLVGGERPKEWRHVFASVQSLAQVDLERDLDPKRFDMVIVDEFHHAAAETYDRLLKHLQPRVLVGLTATPERADGRDVLGWFGGRIASELRLWEALEREFLVPFQYFGISDETDLTGMRWKRGTGYDLAELSNLYTGHEVRLRIVLQAVLDKLRSPASMRALGFCVSVDHAEFMARRFTEQGIPSRSVTSRTPPEERRASLIALRTREVNALFTVDLFNEGVDLPEIDTILFLRPTDSATVFLQQLGRGLRRSEGKACVTVLDFIGAQHGEFRFDQRYRALNGKTRQALVREIENGFPTLPAGCHVELDRVAEEIVLSNVRSALRVNWRSLVAELRKTGDITLEEFLTATGLDLEDVYRRARSGWVGVRREAGFEVSLVDDVDQQLGRALPRLLHVDDPERLYFIDRIVAAQTPPRQSELSPRDQRLALMFHFALWGSNEAAATIDIDAGFERLWSNAARRSELLQLSQALRQRIPRVTSPVFPGTPVPLQTHARYTRDEALAALGVQRPGTVREGVRWVPEERSDIFFITVRKSEKHYSPTTMYQDRAVTPSIFQWESQGRTSAQSDTGQRYIHQRERGTFVHLFIREDKESDGSLGTPPYLYAGTASYMSHTNDRPMRILWHLERDLPGDMFHAARVAAG